MSKQKAYLVLEDGTVYQGYFFGYEGEAIGEVVFCTSMVGYIETLTDPSYSGQIIVQTFPLIGNYGMISEDFESPAVCAKAYIVKEICEAPSNFRCEGDIDSFFKENKIVGMYGIDTRALTMKLRECGTMKGIITDDPAKAEADKIKAFSIKNAVAGVSAKEIYTEKSAEGRFSVAVYDFGVKKTLKDELLKRGCDLTVYPYDTAAETIIAADHDGVLLSNGPGDPKDNAAVVEEIKKLIAKDIPVFGVGLGHQLLALAFGFDTKKLPYGHRGANQPSKDLTSGRVYITNQNHGYVVDRSSVDCSAADIYFENVNDNTCEGITYKNKKAFSVQFYPESCVGALGSNFLFGRFIDDMASGK